jgi:hypothetical protein
MAGIVFGLSEHDALKRFSELAAVFLEMNEKLTARMLEKLRAKAEEFRIRQLDYEQVLWQAIQKNDGMAHNFINNEHFIPIAVSCPRCDETLNEPALSCPTCGWDFCFSFDSVSKEQAEAYWQNALGTFDITQVKLYLKAAEQGNATAQNNLGYAYSNGHGVAEDKVEAVKWYRKAAEQGYPQAQFNLGIMYYDGKGVAEDKIETIKWHRKAADQGHASAQSNLGSIYYRGDGVVEDKVEAVKWFRKAAEQGDPQAQFKLGIAYYYGKGITEDKVETIKWYRKAADQGNKDALILLKQLEV